MTTPMTSPPIAPRTTTSTTAARPVDALSAVALVGSPLLLLGYFALYPAYGEIHSADIDRAIAADPGTTRVAVVLALAGVFLAVPAVLAMLRLLRTASPRLAPWGAGLAVVGWMSLVGTLMTDVAAIELGDDLASFKALYDSPFLVALNALACLHIVGGVLLGVALLRTRAIPRALAITAIVETPIHLGANLAGQFWLDALTWIATATVGGAVARALLQRSPEAR